MKKRWFVVCAGLVLFTVALVLPRMVNAPYANQVARIFSVKNEEPVVIGFGGDMMFDRYIRTRGDAVGFETLLSPLADVFSRHDLVVANLEGPITEFDSVSTGTQPLEPNNYVFTFPPETAGALRTAGITHVSLGNNHTLNFGNQGLSQTKQYLHDAGVAYFGEPFSERPHITTIRGMRIGFVSFNEFAPPSQETVVRLLQELAGVTDFRIVYAHWGYEYEHEPNAQQRHIAHAFIDAGADIVVGAHPHVIQTNELYQGKHIYYSLGNLVFDQYWKESVRCGLFLTVTINPKDFSYTTQETTVYLEKDGSTSVATCESF